MQHIAEEKKEPVIQQILLGADKEQLEKLEEQVHDLINFSKNSKEQLLILNSQNTKIMEKQDKLKTYVSKQQTKTFR